MIVKTVPERPGLDPVHTRDVFYGYSLRGFQLFARFDSISGEGVTNAWDGFGRLASSSIDLGGVTRTLAYQYDRNANRTRIAHPDTTYFSTDFDGLNRPWRIREPDNDPIATIGYDAPGRQASLGFLGGTGAALTYDGVSRVASLAHNLAGTSHDSTWTYGRNAASQLSSIARTNDIYAWTSHYAVNRPYTTDGLNRYSAAGAATFIYDANGNLTSDGARTYGYDVENRLVSASPNVTLAYDPLGRLFRVTGGTGTTTFLYDGDALVAEYEAAGNLLHRYVHNVGADVPLVWYEGANIRGYLHADHQGSIVAIDQAYLGPIALNRYDEYGIPAATNQGRFQYTGQIWLPELGMYHYKARVYSPYLGRFLQTDPIGYDDQFNLYAYVGNDPVNLVDPTGTCNVGGGRIKCPGDAVNPEGVDQDWREASAREPNGPRAYGGGGADPSRSSPVGNLLNDVGEITSNALDEVALRMRETGERGRTGEEVVRRTLEATGFTILGNQVYIRDSENNLRVVDFIVETGPGRLMGVEAKYGNNTRSSRQRTIDTRIRLLGGRVVSRNNSNLRYGRRVQFHTIEMNPRLVRIP